MKVLQIFAIVLNKPRIMNEVFLSKDLKLKPFSFKQ